MKIVCEICGNEGYLQHLSKNYYRVRHYTGLDPTTKKPKFEYHKQNLSYIEVFKEQANNNEALSIDPIGQGNIDLNLNNNGSNNQNKRLGSLAWWGSALVRRGSRVQIPPEAPQNPSSTKKRHKEELSRSLFRLKHLPSVQCMFSKRF